MQAVSSFGTAHVQANTKSAISRHVPCSKPLDNELTISEIHCLGYYTCYPLAIFETAKLESWLLVVLAASFDLWVLCDFFVVLRAPGRDRVTYLEDVQVAFTFLVLHAE